MEIKKGFNLIPVKKLVKAGWNYKDEDSEEAAELMDALEANFKRNGQVENILVRELDTGFYEVINGNHRYDIARRVELKELMCFNFGKISLVEAKRITLETNELNFKADPLKLAAVIGELTDEYDMGELLSSLPFDENEVENFNKLLNFSWEDDDAPKDDDSGEGDGKKDWRVMKFDLPIQVAEQLEDQIERFKKILYPNEKPSGVSYVVPIEAMIQMLHQIDDKNITGK